ncbi:MAG: hypothetical protein RLZZ387_3898 [Chloroflexota bacterium]|jgi:hypothetical protein
MPPTILLPQADRSLAPYTLRGVAPAARPSTPATSRVFFAAAHVVPDVLADTTPASPAALDWELTLAYRRYLWSLGLGVAEAMDTAQRGMGLDWAASQELIRRSIAEAAAVRGLVACGAGTDHLVPRPDRTLEEIEAAYEEQVGFVEHLGGRVILMASRALAACARGPEDYARVYGRILSQVRRPVIIHWLGEMFDPQLAGYWGSRDVAAAMDTCLHIIGDHAAMVDGVKISLLSAEHEVTMRRRLPPGVKMYSGDDFHYPELIQGDEQGFSHALLGIFDAIAPVAAHALDALDAGDAAGFRALLDRTVPLSRHIFQTPTFYYKTGVVFLAYLNGHQPHVRMVGGQEGARSIVHLAELLRLADQAGVLREPELAAARMRRVLAVAGIE